MQIIHTSRKLRCTLRKTWSPMMHFQFASSEILFTYPRVFSRVFSWSAKFRVTILSNLTVGISRLIESEIRLIFSEYYPWDKDRDRVSISSSQKRRRYIAIYRELFANTIQIYDVTKKFAALFADENRRSSSATLHSINISSLRAFCTIDKCRGLRQALSPRWFIDHIVRKLRIDGT